MTEIAPGQDWPPPVVGQACEAIVGGQIVGGIVTAIHRDCASIRVPEGTLYVGLDRLAPPGAIYRHSRPPARRV